MDDGHPPPDATALIAEYRRQANHGRFFGQLSIATAPFALLFDPTLFTLLAFATGLIGITYASKEQRPLCIFGVVTALICGIVGHGIQLSQF